MLASEVSDYQEGDAKGINYDLLVENSFALAGSPIEILLNKTTLVVPEN